MRLAAAILVVFLASTVSGCGSDAADAELSGSEGEPARTQTATSDTSTSPRLELAADPSFVLGGVDVPPAEQFSSLSGVAVLPDGSFWVAEWQTGELRRFDEAGAHVRTVGGMGDGPGEFQRPELSGVGPGDSIFVVDQAVGRLTVFTSEGDVGRTAPFFTVFELPLSRPTVSADGSVAAQVSMPMHPGMGVGELTPDSGAIVRIDHPDVDTIGWYRAGRSIRREGRPSSDRIRFTSDDDITTFSDRVLATSGIDFSIRDVAVNRVVASVDRPRRVIDQDLINDIRAEFDVRYDDPEVGRSAISTIDGQQPHRPAHTQGYDRVMVAPNGIVWARPWAAGNAFMFGGYPRPAPDHWDVFAPSGEYLGQVETPGGFNVLAVGSGFILGSRIDDLGVTSLERYELAERQEGLVP